MLRRRHSIWDELERMQEELDSLFEGFWGSSPWWPSLDYGRTPLLAAPETTLPALRYRQPLMDIRETDNGYIATMEMPGLEKDDIKINVTENAIEVKAEKKSEDKQEDKKRGYFRQERSYYGFYRRIPLEPGTDVKGIEASYKNGLLEFKIPKPKELQKGFQLKLK